jgi:molybdate transport system regulatory protein
MLTEKAGFAIRSKIWIEDLEGNVAFGLGRCRILETIQRLGSMQAAARQMQMSYRAVWMRIRASEERIGRQLVVREGKGSTLTPFAENLMKQFKRLQAIIKAESDDVYNSLMSDQFGSH